MARSQKQESTRWKQEGSGIAVLFLLTTNNCTG
jgi:hypothetical protein